MARIVSGSSAGNPSALRGTARRGTVAPGAGDVIGAVAAMAAALRAGAPAGAAWRRAFGVSPDGSVPVARDLLDACGGDRAAASALLAAGRLAAETGAPLADVLDRVGAALAADAEAAGQRAAALAGPRATARVLAWLPASGILLGLALGADPLEVLLDGGVGTCLLAAGTLLTVGGQVWSRRCVRGAVAAAHER